MPENTFHNATENISAVAPITLLAISIAAATAAFILGMMLLSVMGGLNAGPNIPTWYNLAMWIGWPILLGLTAIVPGAALIVTRSWYWPLRLLIVLGGVSFVYFAAGLVLMIRYGLPKT